MAGSAHLQQLVDDRRYDELLREVTLAEIAAAWSGYQHHPQVEEPRENHPEWWAVDLWMDVETRRSWWADEDRVRAGILEIVAAADDSDVGVIGAAIMEVFITPDEGRLAWMDEHAATSDRFRRSLANVYIWEHGDEVLRRVGRAAGVTLPDPRPQS